MRHLGAEIQVRREIEARLRAIALCVQEKRSTRGEIWMVIARREFQPGLAYNIGFPLHCFPLCDKGVDDSKMLLNNQTVLHVFCV